MKKRIFSLLLALVLMAQMLPMSASAMSGVKITRSGQTVDEIYFEGEKVEAKYRPYTGNNGTDPEYCCAAFVSKFYRQVYGITVDHLMRQYSGPRVVKGKGTFKVTEKPVVGDVIHECHGTVTHWAIAKKVSGNKVTVIEQNAWYDGKVDPKTKKVIAGSRTQARKDKVYDITDPGITCYHYDKEGLPGEAVTKRAEKQSTLDYTLYGTVETTQKPSKVGMYFGTSKTNMKVLGTDSASAGLINMWYNTKKYYGNLKANTTYYYQAFAVINGKTIKGKIKNFTTDSGVVGKITKVKKSLRLRKGPGLSYTTLKWIPKGDTVSINLSKSTEKWYYVTYNGVSGYSSKYYIALQ